MPDIAIPQREIEALILWEKEFLQKLIARLITYILPSVVLLALVFFLLSDYCRPFTPITNISAISNAHAGSKVSSILPVIAAVSAGGNAARSQVTCMRSV